MDCSLKVFWKKNRELSCWSHCYVSRALGSIWCWSTLSSLSIPNWKSESESGQICCLLRLPLWMTCNLQVVDGRAVLRTTITILCLASLALTAGIMLVATKNRRATRIACVQYATLIQLRILDTITVESGARPEECNRRRAMNVRLSGITDKLNDLINDNGEGDL